MHDPVKDHLEDYLHGREIPEVDEHIRACESCRVQLQGMQAQALSLRALRAPGQTEPDPGFYSRVMNRIENQTRPSVWSLFGDSLFARRLVYASAGFILLLGAALVSPGPEKQETIASSTPEVILAGDQAPPAITVDPGERGTVLVSLATYQDYQ